ncbi:MAG: cold shock domain-containing protein [Calditrichaceae bacterium]|nr:cold shock domain-containing protein [Calditrichaceae bacterium]MBN2707890.1 cold shock domain-containing protein [Calditrichaceae bacterium]RQV97838.1 MAG: cold shock domain-containing protein [Calditrichota bacterium]
MKTGIVKSWNRQRGFGFIISDEDEYFVNINDVHITLKNNGLKEGQRVTFNIKSDMKGDRAVNVKAG